MLENTAKDFISWRLPLAAHHGRSSSSFLMVELGKAKELCFHPVSFRLRSVCSFVLLIQGCFRNWEEHVLSMLELLPNVLT